MEMTLLLANILHLLLQIVQQKMDRDIFFYTSVELGLYSYNFDSYANITS